LSDSGIPACKWRPTTAIGEPIDATVTGALAEVGCAPPAYTLTVIVYVPAALYVWAAPITKLPSPPLIWPATGGDRSPQSTLTRLTQL
jgi:hypothetical protein